MEQPDHYSVLGVAPTATHEEIKRAYHALSRKIHPDRQPAAGASSGDVAFHQLSVAWEALGDEARRRAYDKQQSARRNKARGVVQDEIDLDEMAFDEDARTYTFPCRCSGSYSISEDDLGLGRDIAPCTDCSLKIRVLYEAVSDDSGGGDGAP